MFSRRYETIVFAEMGECASTHFTELLLSRKCRIGMIVISSHSWDTYLWFRRLPMIKKIHEICRRASFRSMMFFGYLALNPARVKNYKDFLREDSGEWDYLASLGFMRRIDPQVLAAAATTSNIHYSLLPSYAGCEPMYWAIRSGEQVVGVTIHAIDSDMDTGPIMLQEEFNVGLEESILKVKERCVRLSVNMFHRYLADKERYDKQHKTQKDAGRSFFGMPREEDRCIDFDGTWIDIYNTIRASLPYEAYGLSGDYKCYLTFIDGTSRPKRIESNGRQRMAGEILSITEDKHLLELCLGQGRAVVVGFQTEGMVRPCDILSGKEVNRYETRW